MNEAHITEEIIPPEKWQKADKSRLDAELITRPSYTYYQDAWQRLKKNRIAMLGLAVIIIMTLISIFWPLISQYKYYEQNLDFSNIAPRFDIHKIDEGLYVHPAKGLRMIQTSADGELIAAIEADEDDYINKQKIFIIADKTVILDFGDKTYKVLDEAENEIPVFKTVSNKNYRLGSDNLGRDLLVRIASGARISLAIGLIATFVNFVIGVFYGGIAGYFGGWVDNLMIRIIDIISAVPLVLYIILLMVVIGPGFNTIVIAMGSVFWIGTARLVRGQVLSLKSEDYIQAARAIGVSNMQILSRHLIPNTIGPIIVSLTFMVPEAIFTEAFLSFIGLGIPAPSASWGTLCSNAVDGLRSHPYQLFFPAAALSVTILAFNFLGDGLRDALDPRLRK
ncbi:MAG: ABC transporter permease [Proteobacteria bacterium]|nr:ABC transporter permease [Pseudomonadota bacterium]